ncbi:MAG: S-methyl-5-thioribose-1-phosphate isomerase [Deltaproteobacteria bacterium]|nr:S-methyl-5-thioribose-1-phosphate isomerase [Deltaproteobacteria bacterium]MBW2420242.1 S-methyl-5-thioribose-1-phosphate isomerase [Deltaproteobacteria bacterium]
MLDQRLLPGQELYLTLGSVEEIARAIEDLVVRGAPAIGCAAAMGIARAAVVSEAKQVADLVDDLEAASERLARTRPTAVNLFWALERMRESWRGLADGAGAGVAELRAGLVAEARRILDQDVETCRAIGAAGLELVPDGSRILTHCNAGALATGGYGTALGVVRAATEAGRSVTVLADETRPFLQGARLTAWELDRDGIPVTVITDNMPAWLMQCGEVDLVMVGADRIAANGDVANKIGTYGLAVLAKEHGIPFYVAAPLSTIDFATANGDAIPIEERGRREVAEIGARTLVPEGVPVRHPAFDVTPARLVTAIVTERGLARPPTVASVRALAPSD